MSAGAQWMDDEESTLVDLRPNPAFRSSQEMSVGAESTTRRRKRHATATTLRGDAFFRHDAEVKQEAIWEAISKSPYRVLPSLSSKERMSFSTRMKHFFSQGLWPSAPDNLEDVSGAPVTPAYHRFGATALASFVPATRHPFSGLVAHQTELVIRVSLAIDPDEAFVPGLSIKWLIDGQPSVNVCAMHDISGEQENNVFGSQLSNVLVRPRKFATRWLAGLRSSRLMEQPIEQVFTVCPDGTQVKKVEAGTQLLFCPTDLARSRLRGVRDFRRELPRLAVGSPLYEVYAVSDKYAEPVLVGRIELSSAFLSSEFQDTRLQFGMVR